MKAALYINGRSYLDSCTSAPSYSIRYSSTRRINHGHEAKKAEVFSIEIYFLCVKCKTLRKSIIGETEMAETWNVKHSTEYKT